MGGIVLALALTLSGLCFLPVRLEHWGPFLPLLSGGREGMRGEERTQL